MKYLLLFLLWGYNAGAQVVGELRFDTIVWAHGTKPELIKCKHIYVATHQDSVEYFCKINGHPMMQHLDPEFLGGMGYQGPVEGAHSAKHDEKNRAEGIALVCVKCFHQTRQKIHYKHKE